MNTFKKYFCACECIYDLFGFPKPQPYISVFNPNSNANYNHKPSSKYVSTSRYRQSLPTIPEVIHHQQPHQQPHHQYIYQFANDVEPMERNLKHESTQTHDNDVHIDLENANIPEEQSYQNQSYQNPSMMYTIKDTDSTQTNHEMHLPKSTTDPPKTVAKERDMWHIL